MNDLVIAETAVTPAPFSLKDAPSFIERQFPVGRISAEAHKERKANVGQTLTALGSYWKGRKPLILVRAVVLGSLLPASDDPTADLDIFLKLMAMDDAAFARRYKGSPAAFAQLFPDYAKVVTELDGRRTAWRSSLSRAQRHAFIAEAFATLPYETRIKAKDVQRPEECDEADLLAPIWVNVNRTLGTAAYSLPELIEQLGIARFGERPKIADTFCGGGSIPFEAARLGCDVYASDLNPIACLLTWGAFNIIGTTPDKHLEIECAQRKVEETLDTEITRLGIEHDAQGNRAKAFLYCLETRCPKTGWMVPMAPTWIISKSRKVVARLVPDPILMRYGIEIHAGVSADEMAEAEYGTVQGGRLVHPANPERSGVEIKVIRNDYRNAEGDTRNRLRAWEKLDFVPRPDDIFQERLYCIQWITKDSFKKGRQETYFSAITEDDLTRERKVEAIVRSNLARWQEDGLVPDMPIEPGENTTQPIRERGWTHWHHLFFARSLHYLSLVKGHLRSPELMVGFARLLDFCSRLSVWENGLAKDLPGKVFSNQALNTWWAPALRSSSFSVPTCMPIGIKEATRPISTQAVIRCQNASDSDLSAHIFITDPPYADAVNYHEITEFFIAWLRKYAPEPFDQWCWDSRRDLAIKGKAEDFRRDMVAAYAAMARRMPENGQQIVMFTHQDVSVWADLAAILWAAGLRVSAAWNIVTETDSLLKEGNYVQGTVCLVLRKRAGTANARRMEIEAEIEGAVAIQLAHLTALDDSWHERTNAESIYTDGDLTLAAYAAALQVVTAYSTIDRRPLDRDLYRKLAKNETTMLRDLVDYAAQVANGLLVPEGFPRDMWRDLGAAERFYVRMLDMEAKGSAKVADFQNFAKSFAFGGYADLMASTTANAAALAGAADLKGRMLSGDGFWGTQLRQILFAVWKTMEGAERDPKRGVIILKSEYAADYWQRRQKLIALAAYVALKTGRTRPDESAAAHELAEALRLDRLQ